MKYRLFYMILVVLVVLGAGYYFTSIETPKRIIDGFRNYDDLNISLGEEFVLHRDQSATIEEEDFRIKILEFHNSPCTGVCVWSGVGISFEYTHNGEVREGIDLARAFGFQTTVLDTDNETFAKLIVTKFSQ